MGSPARKATLNKLNHLRLMMPYFLSFQSLAKQLANSKDTITQYAIQCGELEDKVTELKHAKSDSEKKIAQLELAVSNKVREIKLLQVELDDMRINSGRLEEDNDLLKKKSEEISELLVSHTDASKDDEIYELKTRNKSLDKKIQSISKQKMKLESEITTLTEVNHTLEQSLTEAEDKANKLQSKIVSLESEKQPSHVHGRDSVSSDTTDHHHPNMEKKSESTSKNGVSLFGELDEQFLQLQKQFHDLVTSCNCSASLPYRHKYPYNNHKKVEMSKQPSVNKKPFQHIFDKIYATLKETTIVADRLLVQTTIDTIDAENITEGVIS